MIIFFCFVIYLVNSIRMMKIIFFCKMIDNNPINCKKFLYFFLTMSVIVLITKTTNNRMYSTMMVSSMIKKTFQLNDLNYFLVCDWNDNLSTIALYYLCYHFRFLILQLDYFYCVLYWYLFSFHRLD